jgi:long-chain acyl-CoA synthetase
VIESGSGAVIPGGPSSAATVLDAGLVIHPEREALVGHHGRFTWAELDSAATRAARALESLGVGSGDRVAMALPNDVDIVIGFLACMRLGAIWLGVSLALAPPEKAYLLGDSGARVLLATATAASEVQALRGELPGLASVVVVDPEGDADEWREQVAMADPNPLAVHPDPHAPAAIAYTSGTTGFPKGAVHSQHNLLLPGAVARARGQYRDDDRIGVLLPLTLVNLIALGPLLAWQVGAPCIAIDRVDPPGLAAWIRDERVSAVATVPTIMHGLLTHPDVTPADGCTGIASTRR